MAKRSTDDEVARTLQIDDGETLRHRALAAAAQVKRRPTLVVVLGEDVGRRARVRESALVVGRSHAVDLTLTDPRVSSRHCRIEDRGDGWALVELGSTNGTSVNGARVETEVALHPNDKVEVGDTVIRFELQDATDQAYDELVERLIDIDDLTGLYVRRRFDREVEELLRAARVKSQPLGMLVMDLDGLKGINDSHGHLFGAYVIAESGRLIGQTIPDGAIAARFGGDEFVAAFPAKGLGESQVIAEAILAAVLGHGYEKDGVTLAPGISIGVAAFPEHASDATALFRCADEAMYQAKREGKRRVCVCR
ncbi:MAG: GGDEF domain-containing protein [Sandaracinaceae bacterium]|nr:hypothetical protein [Myxococcales bacterium]